MAQDYEEETRIGSTEKEKEEGYREKEGERKEEKERDGFAGLEEEH